ncbi:MAG: hypothetical protein FWH44_04490 [Methanomassiliicoccaceae archaeon]|nr:hypothetical protein [Methanomassiliicoccaceae archaeon]
MESKLLTFLLVGVLVGAGVGIGVGYVLFNEGDGGGTADAGAPEVTYWFYLDTKEVTGTAFESGWISATAEDPVAALCIALKAADLFYDEDDVGGVNESNGWISHIGGIYNGEWGDPGAQSWMSWFWAANELSGSAQAWKDNPGFSVCIGNVFYLAYTEAVYGADAFGSYIMMTNANPNDAVYDAEYNLVSIGDWAEGGPFA